MGRWVRNEGEVNLKKQWRVKGELAIPPCWAIKIQLLDDATLPLSIFAGDFEAQVIVHAERVEDAIAAAVDKFPNAMVVSAVLCDGPTHILPACPTPNWDMARTEWLLKQASKETEQ
jgi:hypothetical protein